MIVGSATGDDAAVYRINERTALVYTVDFFTPIVDDAYDWGRIAATNAFSDVYAMGGRPLLCLNIAGWPVDDLPLDLLGDVLEGGADAAASAGAVIAGGHAIDDREPKYGMAVVGIAEPDHLITNDRARPGDRLVLTKPLGIGVITTGIKREVVSSQTVKRVVDLMTTSNAAASAAAVEAGVSAGTDVTGFGLLGHLQRVLASSGVAAVVRAGAVPILDEAVSLARDDIVPGGTRRNQKYLSDWVAFEDGVADELRILLADAQTSGGLLLSVPEQVLPALLRSLDDRGVPTAVIGEVEAGQPGQMRVLS